MKNSNSTKNIAIKVINVLVILALVGATGYFYNQNQDLKTQINLTTEQKNQRLVDDINKVYKLPDETPVVAIVTEPDQFKKQYPTFTDANSGDYLLFFRKARLNVLYRQSENRVVKTANVVVPISVELVGSQTAVDATESKLGKFGSQITVSKTVKEGITQTFVYDVDQDQQTETSSIAKELGYEVGSTLPTSIVPADQTEVIILVANPKPAETTP